MLFVLPYERCESITSRPSYGNSHFKNIYIYISVCVYVYIYVYSISSSEYKHEVMGSNPETDRDCILLFFRDLTCECRFSVSSGRSAA